MSDGSMVFLAPCAGCLHTLAFTDAERVPSLPIDPGTGLPPDVGNTDPANAIAMPLCPSCFRRHQRARRERGEPVVPAPPGGWPEEYREAARG